MARSRFQTASRCGPMSRRLTGEERAALRRLLRVARDAESVTLLDGPTSAANTSFTVDEVRAVREERMGDLMRIFMIGSEDA